MYRKMKSRVRVGKKMGEMFWTGGNSDRDVL